MSVLPVDLIVDILCRLPVKSLVRFRCLSNQFRSIIDDPDFIKRHHQNRSLDQRLIVKGTTPNLFSVDIDSADNAIKLELPFENWGSDFSVIGSCDGLLALTHRHLSIGLWNISTKKHQILPKFWSDFIECDNFFDGFGYDSATDDYKWVRIIKPDNTNFPEVTVYSLKANSWRRIEDFPPYHNYCVDGIVALVGGALNWVVGVIDVYKSKVMSFDLKDEKFCEVLLPDIDDEAGAGLHVMVLGGCLCMSYVYPLEIAFDIWVMKEYGVKESWTKLFSFTEEKPLGRVDYSLVTIALGYSKRGDEVLFYQDNGEVFRHDLEMEKDESVVINEWPTYISCLTVYVDSLVSPNVDT